MLRETVRKVCATHSPLSVVRELEDDPVGYATELWKQMAELDLIGLLLPEEHGGSGMTALEGVVLYEELGRALAPTPHFASAVLCGGGPGPGGLGRSSRTQWLAPIATRRGHRRPRRGSSPRTAAGRRGSRCGPSPTGRATASPGPSATSPSRPRPSALRGPGPHRGRGPDDVDLFLVGPAAEGCDAAPAADGGLRHPVPGHLRRRARGRRSPHRGPAVGLGNVGRRHARRLHPPRPPRPWEGPSTRSTSPCSTPRTASSSTSPSVPSRPSPTTWPTPSPPSTEAPPSSTRRPGPAPRAGLWTGWRPWPSSSPAAPTAT